MPQPTVLGLLGWPAAACGPTSLKTAGVFLALAGVIDPNRHAVFIDPNQHAVFGHGRWLHFNMLQYSASQ